MRVLVFLTSASAELEMTVNILIQIDKLVQLLESPVFTCKSSPVYIPARALLCLPYYNLSDKFAN